MIKRIVSLMLALLLCMGAVVTASAAAGADFVVDGADLLSADEEFALWMELERISNAYGAQVAVVTAATTEAGNMDDYISLVYDENGYGYGEDNAGVLLLVCMDRREYRICSEGFAAEAVSMNDIDAIWDVIAPGLSDGDYAQAFAVYAEECEYLLDGYDSGSSVSFVERLLIALAIGAAVGFVVVMVLKGQLKSVRKQDQANFYVKPGSMHLTQSGDHFMYRSIVRTEKKKTSGSASGSSRNIGGGKF